LHQRLHPEIGLIFGRNGCLKVRDHNQPFHHWQILLNRLDATDRAGSIVKVK
jgi:hypothetical protein